jgi:alkylation response protein AidB-like acyl-CoA dehydrogenase
MTNLELNETHEMIRDTAREFAKNEVAPTAIERDIKGEFPHEAVKKLGELGFMGMMVSEEWGGAGLDTVSYVIAMEEISAVDASVGVVMSVNNSLVCWALEKYGTEEQKKKYLEPLATGQKLGAYALSEPEAGSDATQQRTEATKNDDGSWSLNGTKNWITNGTTADVYLVYAQTDREKGYKGISCFIIEKETEGFTQGVKEDKLGIRSSDTCSLQFQDARVPAENVLGPDGRGFYIAMETLNGGRIGIGAQALGIAQGALDAAIRYSQERKAFGEPISKLQAIQFKLAEMATKIQAARLLLYEAASKKDRKEDFIKAASMAKLFASQTAVEVTLEAVQIHGGYGYVREYKVERYLRDAKITEIYEGTSEIQHIVIARQLQKEYEAVAG